MAEINVTITGNLTGDPDIRFLPNGTAVSSFSVASTPRTMDAKTKEWSDGETTFMRVTAWKRLAEQCSDVLRKGDPVIVVGKLSQRSYDKNGETKTVFEVTASEVGVGLRAKKLGGNAAGAKNAAPASRGNPTGGGW